MRIRRFSAPHLAFHRTAQIHHVSTVMSKMRQGNGSRSRNPLGSWIGRPTLSSYLVRLHPQRQAGAFLIKSHRLGVFLANCDSAIILALFRQIASGFDQLSSASWIVNGYQLGLIVAQPLVCSWNKTFSTNRISKPCADGAFSTES